MTTAPDWALGFPLEELKEVAQLFNTYTEGLIYGRFGSVQESEVAAWREKGVLHEERRGGRLVAALVYSEAKAARAVRDFRGEEIGRIKKGDIVIKRWASSLEPGDVPALQTAAAFALICEHGRAGWVEAFLEHPTDQALVEELRLYKCGTKISAASEMRGVFTTDKERQPAPIPPEEEWTLRKSAHDITIGEPFREELLRLEEWAPHYSGYNKRDSWWAIGLRTFGGDPKFIEKPSEMSKGWKAEHPEELKWEIQDTELLEKLPHLRSIVDSIPGEKERVRLMKLTPGGELSRHSDITSHEEGTYDGGLMRIHVPIQTNPGVSFSMWNANGRELRAHLAAGEVWYLDTRKPHQAVNEGAEERVHLVLDVVSSPELRQLFADGEEAHLAGGGEEIADEVEEGMVLGMWEEGEEAPAVVDPGLRPEWIAGDSREKLDEVEKESVDFIFSCPPYAYLEQYSDDERDLSNLPYEEFLRDYKAIIKKSVARLKPDRFAAFVVGEIRQKDSQGNYQGFVADTIEAFEEAGAPFYNEAILVTPLGTLPVRAGIPFKSSRKLGKTHQNLLVFCKGNAKKATEAVGEVEVVFPEAQD